MPPAVRALQAWGIGEYKVKNVTEDNPLWMEDAKLIVRASARSNMTTLANLEFFNRNNTGQVTSIMWAERAVYANQGWTLSGVQTLIIDGANGEPRQAKRDAGNKVWTTRQTPETIARLAAEPRDLALSDMKNFQTKGKSGSKPSFAYAFWYWHRITRPLAALILLICAVPMMQRTGREDTGDKALMLGIIMGFVYLIIDGAMATFAASGAIAPLWAISMPLVVFGFGGVYMCLKTESLK